MPGSGGARGRRGGRSRGGCLTQRGELEGRVDGPAHHRAQGGALTVGGQRGEHVFGRLGGGSDGSSGGRGVGPQGGSVWLWSAVSDPSGCNGSCRTARFAVM